MNRSEGEKSWAPSEKQLRSATVHCTRHPYEGKNNRTFKIIIPHANNVHLYSINLFMRLNMGCHIVTCLMFHENNYFLHINTFSDFEIC